MKKILLIEDRPGRQLQFIGNLQADELSNLEGLKSPQESECRTMIECLNSENVGNFANYDLIIVHKSSLNSKGLNTLNSICKKGKIDLILFSGGLSQLNYQNDGYRCLSINSKDFYSNHLIYFIKKYLREEIQNLLELIYGDNWKLSFLLQYRQLKTIHDSEADAETKIMLDERLKIMEENFGIIPEELDNNINNLIASI